MSLEYRDPGEGGRGELIAAVNSGHADEICEAMVAAVFNIDDWKWLQDSFLRLLNHSDWSVRAIAVTCLGHVATFYDNLDVRVVVPAIEELLSDPRTRGYAQAALEDIAQLSGPRSAASA